MQNKMLYKIKKDKHNEKDLKKIVTEFPEVKFVSLMGIDLYGNGTEEKIPINIFLKNLDNFLDGIAVQTDGSSVALPGIATLNDAKIDMVVDKSCDWFIDYNKSLIDEETNKPVGTIIIPSFLYHGGKPVDSRSILKSAEKTFQEEVLKLLKENSDNISDFNPADVEEIKLDTAAELEFWVKTPNDKAEIEALTVSECLQEQYWTKINGPVRTALEETLITIIVMLILVGVTVNVALNGGLFKTAKDAANGTQVEADRETLQSAVIGAIDTKTLEIPNSNALLNNLPGGWEVTGNGPFTCISPKKNKFKVTKDGDIRIKEDKTLTDLEKYILGEDGEGGVELFGTEGTTGILDKDFSFINIPEELQNNGGLTFKTYALVSSSDEIVSFKEGEETVKNNVDIYFTYNGATYKFRALLYNDSNIMLSKTIADIGIKNISYDETTKVGKKVYYDNKIWVILYDDSEHGLQMISEDSFSSSSIRLGYKDPILNEVTIEPFPENKTKENASPYLDLERAVYSYNNAVKTLNDACRDLVTPNSKITSVRSVGSRSTGDAYADDVEPYTQKKGDTNTQLITWPETSLNYNAGVGNGKGKTTDVNYEEDFDRMVALGINVTDPPYLLASRIVEFNSNRVCFGMRDVSNGLGGSLYLWRVQSANVSGDNTGDSVRPVVSLSSDALIEADSSAEYDYTIGEP